MKDNFSAFNSTIFFCFCIFCLSCFSLKFKYFLTFSKCLISCYGFFFTLSFSYFIYYFFSNKNKANIYIFFCVFLQLFLLFFNFIKFYVVWVLLIFLNVFPFFLCHNFFFLFCVVFLGKYFFSCPFAVMKDDPHLTRLG